MADLDASVRLNIATALAQIDLIEQAIKRATSASLNLTGGATGVPAATQQVQALGGAASTTFRQFSQLAQVGTTITKFVTLPIAGAAAASVELATQFDASLTKLTTLAGVSKTEIGGIRQALLDLAPEVGSTPKALSDGLFIVESSGIHGSKAMDVLKTAAEGAALGLGDVNKIAGAVTTILNAYPGITITAAQATNVLVAATKEGKVNADEFASQLGRVVEPASLVGINIGEVAGSLATLTRVTGSASGATTAFQGLLRTFIKPSAEAQKALGAVGLSAVQLLDDLRSKGLLAVLAELKTAFGDNTLELGKLFRNTQGLTAFLGLTQDFQQTTSIFQETAKAYSSIGTDVNGFGDVTQTAAFKFKQARAEIEKAGISIGETLAPPLASAAQSVASFIGSFADLSPTVKTAIEVVAGIAAIGGPILLIIGQVGKLKAAIEHVPDGLQSVVGAVAKVTGVAVASLAAFGAAFEATQTSGAASAAGIVASLLSIGGAFAAGGPIGGAIATIAAIGGGILGVFEANAKATAEFQKKAHELAGVLIGELDPALQATLGFKINLGDIVNDAKLGALKKSIEDTFTTLFNVNDKRNLNEGKVGVQELADAAFGGVDALNKMETSIASTALSSTDFELDLRNTGVTVDELAAATVRGKDAVASLFQQKRNALYPDGIRDQETLNAVTDSTRRLTGETDGLASTFGKANNQAKIVAAAVDDLNVGLENNRIAASNASSQNSGYGQGLIDYAAHANDAARAQETLNTAALDFNAEFGKTPPIGIEILDQLGLTVDELTGSYKDLTAAVKGAEDEILKELGIPLSAAEAQSKAIADQEQLVRDATDAAGKPVTTTTATKRNKRTGKVTGGDTVTIPTEPVTLDQAFNTDITGNIAISDAALKVRNDLIAGLKKAYTDYVTSIATGTSTVDAANATYQGYITNLENTFGLLGINKDAVDGFVAALKLTPAEVSTIITAIGLADKVKTTAAYSKLLNDLPPDVATAVNAATTGDERVAILSGYLNDIKDDPTQTATIKADVLGLADAEELQRTIENTKSKTVTVTVRTVTTANDGTATGTRGNGTSPTPANGGFVGTYANGGVYAAATGRVPQIASTRGPVKGILWAEPETGWEAYISGKPSMRSRNIGILRETARRFGLSVITGSERRAQGRRFADGGIIGGASVVTVDLSPIVSELRLLRTELDNLKAPVYVSVQSPASTNPDTWGAKVGHAVQVAAA